MKLRELLNKLENLPLHTLDLEVLMDSGKSQAVDFGIETVFEDGKMTGFILVPDRQLRLPFESEPK